MADLVHVTDMQNARAFPINGDGLTVREAVGAFLAFDPDSLEEDLGGRVLRLVNFGDVTANLDRQLQANDVITIYAAAVATGGIKGAVR